MRVKYFFDADTTLVESADRRRSRRASWTRTTPQTSRLAWRSPEWRGPRSRTHPHRPRDHDLESHRSLLAAVTDALGGFTTSRGRPVTQ
jgi:hypothetical protein